jgi:hypothetical protein
VAMVAFCILCGFQITNGTFGVSTSRCNTFTTITTSNTSSKDDAPAATLTSRKENKPSCPPGSHRYPSGVCRDDDNRFTLPGTWQQVPTVVTREYFNDQKACGQSRRRVYPFGEREHGCCSDQPSTTATYTTSTNTTATYTTSINTTAIYWPDSYTQNDSLVNTSQSIYTFLQAVQDRTVLFLGDSMTLVIFEGIVMQLKATSILFKEPLSTDSVCQHQVYVPTYNVTLHLLYFYDLEDPRETDLQHKGSGPYHLKQFLLSTYLQSADIVMANVGLHNWPFPSFQGRQMNVLYDLFRQEQTRRSSLIKGSPLCFVWRTTLPQHFPTHTGTGQYGDRWENYTKVGCVQLPKAWSHPSDQALEAVRFLSTKNHDQKPPLLDYTSIFQNSHQFHSMGKKSDCSHYCYSPRLWSPLLLVTAEAIQHAC